ncbi:uncharacterized protein LOC111617770 [Centruroides sculpturatus]|uniref:uncharacterized protein LOC111614591 n=1 Tax=Centruroides sculpturatus TaxID=218467 RepID=UPI000C6CAD2C|nr:uncharacterized protein LOC111614591 [Centruroides sculpturatus]XP_023214826.1 uncharacterized protein LOC111617770 [Centruroides sculpturatus]
MLLSSMHYDAKIDEITGDERKPKIIFLYNITKGGVDTVGQLCATYSIARNSRHWLLTLFSALMNIAGINAQEVYENNTATGMIRRAFIKAMGLKLIEPYNLQKQGNKHLTTELKLRLKRLTKQSRDDQPPAKLSQKQRFQEKRQKKQISVQQVSKVSTGGPQL